MKQFLDIGHLCACCGANGVEPYLICFSSLLILQVMMFSATLADEMRSVCKKFMQVSPVLHNRTQ